MSNPLCLISGAFVLACVLMTLVWWHQLHTRNAGMVDAWWSYAFGMITVFYGTFAEGDFTRKLLITFLVMLWSFRLGTHLFIRNAKHMEEDSRYKKLREEYGQREKFKMWRFFIYQAISNVLLSIPFLIVCLDRSGDFSFLFWIGIILWIIAIFGESVADHQLKAFKQNPLNKGKVCQTGLWKYSRHPNYFFEWLVWVSYAILATSSPYGWMAWFCPLIMYLLLTKVTGIPMLEELAVISKGNAYVRYQQTTSAFFLWFRRKGT
jgi:steroid 5-alpha reductase family enzyme